MSCGKIHFILIANQKGPGFWKTSYKDAFKNSQGFSAQNCVPQGPGVNVPGDHDLANTMLRHLCL